MIQRLKALGGLFSALAVVVLLLLVAVPNVKAASGDMWALKNTSGVDQVRVTSSGHFVPGTTASKDLGSSSLKFRNLYVGNIQTDTDGGNGASFDKLSVRLSVRQTAGAGIDGTSYYTLIEDGETVTDWTATTNVTASADTTYFRWGSKALKLAFTAAGVAGNGAAQAHSSEDWSDLEYVGLWIRSDTALAAGNLVLVLTDGTQGDTSVNIPAVSSVDTWTFVRLDISGVANANKDDVDAVSIELSSAGATALGAFNVQVDQVFRWDASGDLALSGTPLDGGVIGVWTIPTATGGDRTLAMLTEGTDFLIDTNGNLVFVTDQSGKQVLATYATQ